MFQTSHVIELVAKLLVHIESINDMEFPVYVVDKWVSVVFCPVGQYLQRQLSPMYVALAFDIRSM